MLSAIAIAAICHNANKMLCEVVGDASFADWSGAQGWQIQRSVESVKFILDNPIAPIEAGHDAWAEEMRAEGWKYGPVKDAEKKENPALAPFSELPPIDQARNQMFRAIVLALAPFYAA